MSDSFSVHVTEYPVDCGEAALRQVGLGIRPLLLLEPEIDEETDDVSLNLTLSLIDREETIEVLDLVLDVLRNGVAS